MHSVLIWVPTKQTCFINHQNVGANMALAGKVVQDELECPFHEWRFDANGKCVHIPELKGPIPEVAKVKSWPTHEYMGNVYVWFDAEGRPPGKLVLLNMH